MSTLERLKEPLPGPCLGGGAEILKGSGNIRYYIDFPGIKGGSVDVSIAIADKLNAIPALIAVAEAVEELAEVARLRGECELPHPANDPKLWTARMQTAWDEVHAALDALEVEE